VTDVRGFVGVDAGVLDERVYGVRGRGDFASADDRLHGLAAVEAGVDVAGSGDLECRKAFDRAECSDDLFGDFARGFAELAGQFEGERQSVFTEGDLGRLLDRNLFGFDLVLTAQDGAKAFFELFLLF
jgi:hypothetical protein